MMAFPSKWLSAAQVLGALIVLGYSYACISCWQALTEKKQLEIQLTNQLVELKHQNALWTQKTSIPMMSDPVLQRKMIVDLSILIKKHHITLNSIKFPAQALPYQDIQLVELILQGNFQNLYSFINGLDRRAAFIVQTFIFRPITIQNYQLDLSILMLKSISKNTNPFEDSLIHDPFCHAADMPEIALADINLCDIHMAGYLISNKEINGLIQLVNGKMFIVKEGTTIGKQKAKVAFINKQSITLILPNNNKQVLTKKVY